MECRLDEHLKFPGKTRGQRKCSRSALTGAYVDKRVTGKKGSTNKYQYRSTSAGEKSNAPWDGLVDLASTWFSLRHARLKVVVPQRTVVSRFACSVFETTLTTPGITSLQLAFTERVYQQRRRLIGR